MSEVRQFLIKATSPRSFRAFIVDSSPATFFLCRWLACAVHGQSICIFAVVFQCLLVFVCFDQRVIRLQSSHQIWKRVLRHWFTNICNFCVADTDDNYFSHLYGRMDLTFELEIRSFVSVVSGLENQIFLRLATVVLAFFGFDTQYRLLLHHPVRFYFPDR